MFVASTTCYNMKPFIQFEPKHIPKLKAIFVFFALMLLGASNASAQLKASFKVDTASGCSVPALVVKFINTTQGATSKAKLSWDFDNTNTSTRDTAVISFNVPRTYNVTLTVTDGNNSSTYTYPIVVHKNPTTNFSASPASGCSPFKAAFIATSVAGEGSIDKYVWDFGDGHTSSGKALNTVSNTYLAGQYTVNLTVANTFGCQSTTVTKTNLINAFAIINPAFTAKKTALCGPADTVFFSNTSLGSTPTSSLWNFGDGITSTANNPFHNYPSKGIYTVTLIETSVAACSDTLIQKNYINIHQFTASIVAPSPICSGDSIAFQGTVDPKPLASNWYFSDDNYSDILTGLTINKKFGNAGNYTAILVNDYGGCKDSAVQQVSPLAAPILHGFKMTDSLCGTPATALFRDTTKGAVSWAWDFGAGAIQTDTSASFTYLKDGNYTIGLTVKNAAGCSATVQKQITLKTPKIKIAYNQSSSQDGFAGCPGLQITFNALPDNPATAIAKYEWDFGDNTQSKDTFPTHTFSLTGKYHVTLAFSTTNGCTGIIDTFVRVFDKPKASFFAKDTLICGNSLINFTNTSTPNQAYSHYIFINGKDVIAYNIPTATGRDTIQGIYDVMLITGNGDSTNGYCYDTLIRPNYLSIVPPFPKIDTIINTCDGTRGVVTFKQATRLATKLQWNFGDNSPILDTNLVTVSHTYVNTGKYTVIHTATNGACTIGDTATAYVLLKQRPLLSLSASEICVNSPLTATISRLESNPNTSPKYQNYFITNILNGDSTAFAGTTNPAYYNPWRVAYTLGLYGLSSRKENLFMIINSQFFGCADTTNPAILKLNGPDAGFKVNGNICFNKAVVFTDSSFIKNKVSIVQWDWDFGDNTTATITSNKGQAQHFYTNPGSYQTSLKVTDANGCTSTTLKNTHVQLAYGPKAEFTWRPTYIAPGKSATFYDSSIVYGSTFNKYLWHFSSNGQYYTSKDSVVRNYPKALMDTIKLVATDPLHGCIDSTQKIVPVRDIIADFRFTSNYLNPSVKCPPILAQFTGIIGNVTSFKWLFGDSSVSFNNKTPSHVYYKPGTYKVTLIAYGNNSDSAVVENYIAIKGPYARLTSDVQQGCFPYPVTLTANETNSPNFQWVMGDGSTINGTDTILKYSYASPGKFLPAILIRDNASANCKVQFDLPTPILVDTLGVTLANTPYAFCINAPKTIGILKAGTYISQVGNPVKIHWDFGTGNANDIANIDTPSFKYPVTGVYRLKLDVKTTTGCEVKLSETVTVKAAAPVTISGQPFICENTLTQYTAATTYTDSTIWKWAFNNGHIDSVQTPAMQSFTEAGSPYKVYVTTNVGDCATTDSLLVTATKKPVISITNKNSRICLGDSVQLSAGVVTGTYAWEPSQYVGNPAIYNPYAKPTKSTRYTLTVTNKNCPNSDTAFVRVIQPFKLVPMPDTYVCIGKSTMLHASSLGIDSFQWINETSTLNNIKIDTPTATPVVTTTYTVIGYDTFNCFTDKGYATVYVAQLPVVNVGADTVIWTGTDTHFNPMVSNDVTEYKWLPDTYLDCTTCPTPKVTPRSNMVYTLNVKTQYGCEAKGNITIQLKCGGLTLAMPTGFVPASGNSKTNRLYPMGKGVKKVRHFSVYNRMGALLFQQSNFDINDPSFGWDGRYHDTDQPAGAYIYVVEATCDTGDPLSDKGTIVLIR
ncbi:PKD domain-containing protein [Parasediminibacterium sp. JCM 36343]|uniref:PKD domain-containing protein n=1 Tax=Parasediminibacterium sp. JCM 36343 TaxID=3374279 RepID=UPI00397CAD61